MVEVVWEKSLLFKLCLRTFIGAAPRLANSREYYGLPEGETHSLPNRYVTIRHRDLITLLIAEYECNGGLLEMKGLAYRVIFDSSRLYKD